MEEYVKIRDVERRIADLIGVETKGRCPTWNEVHEALYGDLQSIFIVRCKDCKFRNDWNHCRIAFGAPQTPDDWFCADGDKEE